MVFGIIGWFDFVVGFFFLEERKDLENKQKQSYYKYLQAHSLAANEMVTNVTHCESGIKLCVKCVLFIANPLVLMQNELNRVK